MCGVVLHSCSAVPYICSLRPTNRQRRKYIVIVWNLCVYTVHVWDCPYLLGDCYEIQNPRLCSLVVCMLACVCAVNCRTTS